MFLKKTRELKRKWLSRGCGVESGVFSSPYLPLQPHYATQRRRRCTCTDYSSTETCTLKQRPETSLGATRGEICIKRNHLWSRSNIHIISSPSKRELLHSLGIPFFLSSRTNITFNLLSKRDPNSIRVNPLQLSLSDYNAVAFKRELCSNIGHKLVFQLGSYKY